MGRKGLTNRISFKPGIGKIAKCLVEVLSLCQKPAILFSDDFILFSKLLICYDKNTCFDGIVTTEELIQRKRK